MSARDHSEIRTVEDLDRFFAERAAAESGTEPDWEQHLAVMDRSRVGRIEAP